MKKIAFIIAIALSFSSSVSAQSSDWTLNTRFWTTNYWTSIIGVAASSALQEFAFEENSTADRIADHVIPTVGLVFPIGMAKAGFDSPNEIYGPYHYAFGNPFKHIGDYAIGVDASWRPSTVGAYAGAYFKSQEIVFKDTDDNLRGFYFQPRAGIILGSEKKALEAGVFYDLPTGCGGSVANPSKDQLKAGFGLDFSLTSLSDDKDRQFILQFSMPLHNFLDSDYPGQQGMRRKVGYIMLTTRKYL
ncbi:MAG: hypothetical protein J5486_01755 [Bacteroidaceae bacterium]|nr:hypothetical protein [Bacteroidaceae bacterium]